MFAANDDFFAAKERWLQAVLAVCIPGKYDANGKWMDGWERRMRRRAGNRYRQWQHCKGTATIITPSMKRFFTAI